MVAINPSSRPSRRKKTGNSTVAVPSCQQKNPSNDSEASDSVTYPLHMSTSLEEVNPAQALTSGREGREQRERATPRGYLALGSPQQPEGLF